MLPALWIAQQEIGYVSMPAMVQIAAKLDCTPAKVFSVCSFYTMLDRRPRAKHKVQVCRTLSCAMRGAGELCRHLEQRLGVGPFQDTPDGEFTWEPVECLAACGTAPAAQIDGEYYEHLSPALLDRILDGLAGTADPMPSDSAQQPDVGLGAPSLLTQWTGKEGAMPFSVYRSHGGYDALLEARGKDGLETLEVVKASGLQGRGGAGFPAGVKWGFIPRDGGEPVYCVCNADESEPGAFKDRALLELAPHLVIEGILIAMHATQSTHGFFYLRGEFPEGYRRMVAAVNEARTAGLIGGDTGIELTVHRGAQKGLFQKPTVVNNVETYATVPIILRIGAEKYRTYGNEKSPGTKLVSISGSVKRPGVYEVPLGVPLMEVIEKVAGGPPEGRTVKAVIPGGSSTPILTADEARELPLCFDALKAAGTFLGTGGIIVIDDQTCLVRALHNLARFYAHESCGQCTPCREGTSWNTQLLKAIEAGDAGERELELLVETGWNMRGRTICVLADAQAMPIHSYVDKFRDEFLAHLDGKGCPLPNGLPEATP
jgi:NADH-quinone oxidoreductase subunit F